MERVILTEEEKIQDMEAIKKGEFYKLERFIMSFNLYALKGYNTTFNKNLTELDEEFRQELHTKVLESMKYFRGDKVGQLVNYTRKVIDNFIKNKFIQYEKNKKYNFELNDSEDIHYYAKVVDNDNLVEDIVINKIMDNETYVNFIKGKLTKSEQRALEIHAYYGEEAEKYVIRNGMKFSTYRRTLCRAKNRIQMILCSEEVRKFRSVIMIFLCILSQSFFNMDMMFIDFI